MFYNFVKWLKNQNATITIYANSRETTSTDKCVLIRDTGGDERVGLKLSTIQIIARDTDNVKARKLAYLIYDQIQTTKTMGGRFGQILPQVIIDGVTYPQIQIGQISGIQRPDFLGQDERGLYEYVFNFRVLYN